MEWSDERTAELLAAYQIKHYTDHGLYDAIKGYLDLGDQVQAILPRLVQLNYNVNGFQIYEDARNIIAWLKAEAIAARFKRHTSLTS